MSRHHLEHAMFDNPPDIELLEADTESFKDEQSMLKNWKAVASRYSDLHDKSSKYYKVIKYSYNIPLIFLTSAIGILSISFSQYQIAIIIGGVVQLFIAFMTGLYSFLQISEMQNAHAIYNAEFDKLHRDINLHLLIGNTPHRVYVNLFVYVKHTKEQIDKLIERAPQIPSKIMDNYNNTEKNNKYAAKLTEHERTIENIGKAKKLKPASSFVLDVNTVTETPSPKQSAVEIEKVATDVNIDIDNIMKLEKQKKELQQMKKSVLHNFYDK